MPVPESNSHGSAHPSKTQLPIIAHVHGEAALPTTWTFVGREEQGEHRPAHVPYLIEVAIVAYSCSGWQSMGKRSCCLLPVCQIPSVLVGAIRLYLLLDADATAILSHTAPTLYIYPSLALALNLSHSLPTHISMAAHVCAPGGGDNFDIAISLRILFFALGYISGGNMVVTSGGQILISNGDVPSNSAWRTLPQRCLPPPGRHLAVQLRDQPVQVDFAGDTCA